MYVSSCISFSVSARVAIIQNNEDWIGIHVNSG